MSGVQKLGVWFRRALGSGVVVVEAPVDTHAPEPERPYVVLELVARQQEVVDTVMTDVENPGGKNAVNIITRVTDDVRATVVANTEQQATDIIGKLWRWGYTDEGRRQARKELGMAVRQSTDSISVPAAGEFLVFSDWLVTFMVEDSDEVYRVDTVGIDVDITT